MTIRMWCRLNAKDVTCWRDPPEDPEGRSVRCSKACASVKQAVIFHSPDGFEWGYGGSGPADLALNILHVSLPVGCDHEEPVKLFRGKCSAIAFQLHQDFKRDFIATMPDEGGVIHAAEIDSWIDERLNALMQPEGSTMVEGFPPREMM